MVQAADMLFTSSVLERVSGDWGCSSFVAFVPVQRFNPVLLRDSFIYDDHNRVHRHTLYIFFVIFEPSPSDAFPW